MVPEATDGLTRTSFRRDLRWFFFTLFGFFLFATLALLLVLQSVLARYEEKTVEQWAQTSKFGTDAIERFIASPENLESYLVYLRGRYRIERIDVALADGRVIRSGSEPANAHVAVQRPGPFTATFHYNAEPLRQMKRAFYAITAICLVGAVAGCVLLLLYLQRITRPIEEMLDHARDLDTTSDAPDEARYLIETFKNSIETLRRQEDELKRLHELEKTRADDLERVAATLTRSLSSGFIAIDGQGRIRDLNAAARAILGEPTEEPSARDFRTVIRNDALRERIGEAFASRSMLTRGDVDADGRSFDMTTVPLYDERQKFLGLIILLTDITPIRALEQRLRDLQSLADLGEMSAGIAHEFRNALSTILVSLKLARQQSDSAQMLERIEGAEAEARALAAAVEHLLLFARPMRLQRQPVDLKPLVESVAEQIKRTHPAIDYRVNGGEVTVNGDAVLLARAVENLLRNAAEALAQAGRHEAIEIEIAKEPLSLVIRDRGIGVDPADVPRLMLPFQSGKPNGVGIGLPLARKIFLLHGASLTLTGTPAAGAEVRVEFPEEM